MIFYEKGISSNLLRCRCWNDCFLLETQFFLLAFALKIEKLFLFGLSKLHSKRLSH